MTESSGMVQLVRFFSSEVWLKHPNHITAVYQLTCLSWNSEPVNPPPMSRMFMLNPRSTWTETDKHRVIILNEKEMPKDKKALRFLKIILNLYIYHMEKIFSRQYSPPCQTHSGHLRVHGCKPVAGLGRSWGCGRSPPPPGLLAPWLPRAGADSSSERSRRPCWSQLHGPQWSTAVATWKRERKEKTLPRDQHMN